MHGKKHSLLQYIHGFVTSKQEKDVLLRAQYMTFDCATYAQYNGLERSVERNEASVHSDVFFSAGFLSFLRKVTERMKFSQRVQPPLDSIS